MKTISRICSCTICKKQFSIKGFHSHYISAHTIKGNLMRKKCGALGLEKAIKTSNLKKEQRIQLYLKNPKLCKCCNNPLPYEKTKNKFCSSTCSASFTNKERFENGYRVSAAHKEKIRKTWDTKQSNKPEFTKISTCIICNKFHPKSGKTCSKNCQDVLFKQSFTKTMESGYNPQQNRNRSIPSHLEKSFKNWCKNNFPNVLFSQNKAFNCNGKMYYGDFYFDSLKILIELDGTQHKETVEYDKLRDDNILKYYNVYTIRISHKEFIKKSKVEFINNILSL
jgi:very-short-patch-repair endonuclease/predicted nucleic acid-binding Zn ribbon protein